MKIVLAVLFVIGLAVFALLWIKRMDHCAQNNLKHFLINTQADNSTRYDSSMVAELPEPARRYFNFSINTGTLLKTVVKIKMTGKFSLGSKKKPGYMRMKASQVLASPTGFIWTMLAGQGLKQLSGSDSHRWTRFWMAGILPVARFGGDLDHKRSAFGRYIAESAFWSPASLLPGSGISWAAVDDNTASVTVTHEDISQEVFIKVNSEGAPVEVYFSRWSNANLAKKHQFQPFGGYLSTFRDFEGFNLATHVEAGNFFASDEYFPFYIVDVSDIEFPESTKKEISGVS